MKPATALVLLAGSLTAVTADHYVVIAAGSKGYDNYRHQADACHAYQVFTKAGIPASNIITMMQDDVASSSQNPFPGQLFNRPADGAGNDVYKGCNIDYRGDGVTAQLFLDVIQGKQEAVASVEGTGRVLNSTKNDNVFLAFFDHGGTGLIAFPNGPYLYADDLNTALTNMYNTGMFKQLTFYMEACESGSMFNNKLKSDINVYAVTAANPDESSWGTYCPPNDKVNGKEMNSCLGDLFSVNYLQNAGSASMNSETLEQQFQKVKTETTKSHVSRYGDTSFTSEPIGDFEGVVSVTSLRAGLTAAAFSNASTADAAAAAVSAVDSRDIKLHNLYHAYLRAGDADRDSHRAAVQAELDDRTRWDRAFSTLEAAIRAPNAPAVATSEPRHMECLRNAVDAVEASCGRFSDYALKHVRRLNNLCEGENGNPARIMRHAVDIC